MFLRNPPHKSSQDLCFSNAVLHFLTASCRFRVEEPLYYLLMFHKFVLLNQLHSSVLILHTSDNPVSCKDHIFCLRDYSFLISSMQRALLSVTLQQDKKYLVGSWSSKRIRRTTSKCQVTLKFDQLTQIIQTQLTISATLWLHESYEAKDTIPLRRKAGKRILQIKKIVPFAAEKDFHYSYVAGDIFHYFETFYKAIQGKKLTLQTR